MKIVVKSRNMPSPTNKKEDINEWLQDLIKQSEQLYNYIAHVFFNLANKHDDYNNLLAAAGKMIDVQTALKSCIK